MRHAQSNYLHLLPEIEQAIQSDKAQGRLHPLRCLDEAALRREDKIHDKATLIRSSFARDIDKILNVPAYNRYAGKTQVFSLTENDDICRRGLHVQLVSRIARTIGNLLGLNCELIEAISLGHDVGHTPFGHAGERFLNECYHHRTGRYFNHNVHSVRVLDAIYQRNISLQTLNGALCHNGEFVNRVLRLNPMTSFQQLDEKLEACLEDESLISSLRPSTLEGCVVRVSDMIAYIGKDRDDALKIGAIDSLDVFDSTIMGRTNAQIINNLVVDIVNNSYGKDHIELSEEMFSDLKHAKNQNYAIIYEREAMSKGLHSALRDMFDKIYNHLIEELRSGKENTAIYRHHILQLAKRSKNITPESYLSSTTPDQIAVDYLASMTDDYFMALCAYLFPGDLDRSFTRSYFDKFSKIAAKGQMPE